MSTITMTIANIVPPTGVKPRGLLIGRNGEKIGCFPEQYPQFEIGQTYDIEISDGAYRNAKKAVLVVHNHAPQPQQQAQPAPQPLRVVPQTATPAPQQAPTGGYYKPTAPQDSERMFVCSILNAAVQSGKIEFTPERVLSTVNMLRAVWDRSFGDSNTFSVSEAQGRAARG